MCTKSSKHIIVLFCLLIISLFLSSCFAGLEDWEYTLPHDYSILRCNSESIVFGIKGDLFEQLIDSHIVEFCYNDNFIGLKRIPVDNYSESFDYEDPDYSKVEYYLVDAKNKQVYGPLTSDEFTVKCTQYHVGKLNDWTKTFPTPEGASFE